MSKRLLFEIKSDEDVAKVYEVHTKSINGYHVTWNDSEGFIFRSNTYRELNNAVTDIVLSMDNI